MAFRFSLATLLRLREIAEEREERVLGQILSQISQTRQQHQELQNKCRSLLVRRERQLQEQISAAELHIFYGQLKVLEDLQAAVQEKLSSLDKLRLQQIRVYEAAHRDKEVLSGLRKKQLEDFRYKQGQQDQNAMDDNFISRRSIS